MRKILIADDISTNLALLRQTLDLLGDFDIIEAVDGRDVVAQYEKEKPDLILMDIMMPHIDGKEATSIIKNMMGQDFVPIIFITALKLEDTFSEAIESGGDDFISKPFDIDVLASKISAQLRIRELTQQLNNKNKTLIDVNKNLVNEQNLIEHFFDHAIKQSYLDDKFIKYHMSSLSVFNGDLLLVEQASEDSIYVVMGDFTGHGLTAAMGTLPVAMTFFSMTKKCLSIGEIAKEINQQLYKLMPSSMFFSANILEINTHDGVLSIWAGGMPENYIFNVNNELKETIESQHMPLGILDDDEFDALTQSFDIENEDKIYLYSDGIIETKNANGELFGDERLRQIMLKSTGNRFDDVLDELRFFLKNMSQSDDVTLVELNCMKTPEQYKVELPKTHNVLPWEIRVALTEKNIKSSNSISKLFDILNSLPFVSRYKDILHLLIFEIFNNAIDHSILNLQSIDKSNSEAFTEYYKIRDEKIKMLNNAYINFIFKFVLIDGLQHLEIIVNDSGSGYHKQDLILSDDELHGRGLNIINSFCEKTSFSDDGKQFTALYKL